MYQEYLRKKLDLIFDIPFKEKVEIAGIDFSGTNFPLSEAQKVYNKCLRNCIFEGVYVGPFDDFRDVDIRRARFSSNNAQLSNIYFKDAIYDDETTIDGISFSEIYGPCLKKPKSM